MTQVRQVKTSEKGATLVEAIVALSIVAMVAAFLAPGLSTSVSIRTNLEASSDRAEAQRSAVKALQTLFDGVVIQHIGGGESSFSGGERVVEFDYSQDGFENPIRMRIRADDALVAIDTKGPAFSIQGPIYLDLSVHRILYFGKENDGQEAAWAGTWRQELPPNLVRLELQGQTEAEPQTVRVLDFQILASAPLTCAFDPVIRQCRT